MSAASAARGLFGRLRDLVTAVGAPTTADHPTTTPPVVRWLQTPLAVTIDCPNCGAAGSKSRILEVDSKPLHRASQRWSVVSCPDCTCRFYEQEQDEDYGQDEMLTRGRDSLYVQQGAGLGQLCNPIARIQRPAGSHYLDVGCGFGFGLDFARRAKGWSGQGIDPAQIAALGRDRLGLPIASRLLSDDEPELHGRCDVVMTAETIEHVPCPAAFLATLKKVLSPGGVLALTTPDACALAPATPEGQLVALLSPGLHVVFQSRASLERLLAEVGFSHIRVEHDGCSLVAYASMNPLSLEEDRAMLRRSLRDYLEQRSKEPGEDLDLALGFAGRALFEAANDGDFAQAARVRPRVAALCRSRFGLDLDGLLRLPAETAACSLARMVELVPLNLAAILYADAMCALAGGGPRPELTQKLDCAAEAARRLRRATGELAMEDAMSEDLVWVATAEALLCRAAAAAPDVAGRLARVTADRTRRQPLVDRVFVSLVNAGHFSLAQAVSRTHGCHPTTNIRDVMFAQAMIDLQPGGDAARAQQGFAAVRKQLLRDLAPDPGLYWSALRGETHALLAAGDAGAAVSLCRTATTGPFAQTMPDDLVDLCRSA